METSIQLGSRLASYYVHIEFFGIEIDVTTPLVASKKLAQSCVICIFRFLAFEFL